MDCVICGIGKMLPQKGNFTLERDEKTILFTAVPMLVCNNCGEQYLEDETASLIFKMAEEALATTEPLKVLEFAAA